MDRLFFRCSALLVALGLQACGAAPDSHKTTQQETSSQQAQPNLALDISAAATPDYKRLVRRLNLDLLHQFPSTKDLTAIADNPDLLSDYISTQLATPAAAKAIAEKHRPLWRLSHTRTPDWERLAASDSDLATALTSTLQTNLLSEPLTKLRYLIEQGKPYSELFSGSWGLVHTSLLKLEEESSAGTPWKTESWRLVSYKGERAGLGLLGDYGFAAHFATLADEVPYEKTAAIYQRFTCLPFLGASGHDWSSLTSAQMKAADWRGLALTQKTCFGCHGLYQNLAPAVQRGSHGATLSAWLNYAETNQDDIWFSGHKDKGLTGLASLFAGDPRTQQCGLRYLYAGLLQSSVNDSAITAQLPVLLESWSLSGGLSAPALALMLQSPSYQATTPDPGSPMTNTAYERLHVLNHMQWQDLFAKLYGKAFALSYPLELSPGASQDLGDQRFIPAGSYAHYLNRIARQLADAIVASELASDSKASKRLLLTLLADGSGKDASATLVQKQILALWQSLTTKTLTSNDATYLGLNTLWQIASKLGADADDASRRAWRLVLTGIFMSPDFVSY